nr:hypothetical protein [Variovorax sp. dw_308]
MVHGARQVRTFKAAAAHYVAINQDKTSIETEIYLLKNLMPHIGALELHQVHDSTLAPYITDRLAKGRSHKTINLALGVARQILNLAATSWRDEGGRTWLQQAPKITLLPLVGHQREPRPITWGEQRALLPKLPDHLARMALFTLNTGVRDDVVCNLRWEWEIKVPELGVSVFEVPRQHVKGKRLARVVVCNSVAQSVVDAVRGQHKEFVFVYRRERVKNVDQAPTMAYRPIETMNNTAWAARPRRGRAGRPSRARPPPYRGHAAAGGRNRRERDFRPALALDGHDDAPLHRGAAGRAPWGAGEDQGGQRALEQEPGDAAEGAGRGAPGGGHSPEVPQKKMA